MSNETIFSEVDEELRRDRAAPDLAPRRPLGDRRRGAVVLAVAINEGWSWWQNSNAARSSDQFYAALEMAETGDVAGAETALNAIAASSTGSYPLLAKFRQASLLASQGKDAEAVAAYDALANADTIPRIRELALVLAANVLVDSGDVAGVQQRVSGLVTPDNAAPQRRPRGDRPCPVQGRRRQCRAPDLPGRCRRRARQPRSPEPDAGLYLDADLAGRDDRGDGRGAPATPATPTEIPGNAPVEVPADGARRDPAGNAAGNSGHSGSGRDAGNPGSG